MKRILILGASKYQRDFVLAAKRFGLYAVSVDNIPSNPGHSIANESVIIDVRDVGTLKLLVKQKQISHIGSVASDVCMRSLAAIGAELNLAGPSQHQVAMATLKHNLRAFYQDSEYYLLESASRTDEVLSIISKKKSLYIVKPSDRSGSIGISVVDPSKSGAFLLACKHAFEYSLSGEIVIERYYAGDEYTCEGFFNKTEFVFSAILKKHVVTIDCKPKTLWYEGSLCTNTSIRDSIQEKVASLLNYLSYTGPFNCDVVMDKNTPIVVDFGLRIGGNGIPSIVRAEHGIDEYDVYLRHITDMRIKDAPSVRNKYFFALFTIYSPLSARVVPKPSRRELQGILTEAKIVFYKRYKLSRNAIIDSSVGYLVFKSHTKNQLESSLRILAKFFS